MWKAASKDSKVTQHTTKRKVVCFCNFFRLLHSLPDVYSPVTAQVPPNGNRAALCKHLGRGQKETNPPQLSSRARPYVLVGSACVAVMSVLNPPPRPPRLMNIVYGISNLANYIVGAGILGLPFVFSKTGWAAGCFLILLAAFATSLSFDFLLQASTASGCYSYDALALRTGGTRLQKV